MLHVCQSHITQVYLFCSKFMNVHHYHIKITIIITTIIILVIIKFELDSNLKHIMFIFQLNYYYNYRNPLQHSGNGWIKIWTCFNLPIENYKLIWWFFPIPDYYSPSCSQGYPTIDRTYNHHNHPMMSQDYPIFTIMFPLLYLHSINDWLLTLTINTINIYQLSDLKHLLTSINTNIH